MAQITIQCRLIASAHTRQFLWLLMVKKNTPLINEILSNIRQHPDFSQWRDSVRLPKNFLAGQIKELKNDPRFQGQPSRFYASVGKIIDYIYKSWFKIQRVNQLKLNGNIRWLEMLKPDTQLIDSFDGSWENLHSEAQQILASLDSTSTKQNTVDRLFQEYEQTQDHKIRSAIVYLIKNGCQISEKSNETKKKYQQIKRKLEIKIFRLEKQMEMSIPSGRDFVGAKMVRSPSGCFHNNANG